MDSAPTELKMCLQRRSINIALLRSERGSTCVETLCCEFRLLRSAECGSDLLDPRASFRSHALQRRQKVRMSHTRTEIGPTIRLRLTFHKILAFSRSQRTARCALEGVKIKLRLLP